MGVSCYAYVFMTVSIISAGYSCLSLFCPPSYRAGGKYATNYENIFGQPKKKKDDSAQNTSGAKESDVSQEWERGTVLCSVTAAVRT